MCTILSIISFFYHRTKGFSLPIPILFCSRLQKSIIPPTSRFEVEAIFYSASLLLKFISLLIFQPQYCFNVYNAFWTNEDARMGWSIPNSHNPIHQISAITPNLCEGNPLFPSTLFLCISSCVYAPPNLSCLIRLWGFGVMNDWAMAGREDVGN